MKYLFLVLISIMSFSVNSNPVGDCTGTPKDAITLLPSPLNNWGQIVCTPYGHIISSKQGYVWSNVGTYSPVMIPSQMVRTNPKSIGNKSYFTSVEMDLLQGDDAVSSAKLFESGFDKSTSTPKVYSLRVKSISGKELGFKFFDYGDSQWGMWCNKSCDPNSKFMILNMAK
ncbi:hypothetical protein HC752_23330 [Vibrio sp. S9_S30]|uniref:hypothetical protein n=1 Tax=Vibrio sp. S9_S30 TaxID=2720226 RepID=UPI0016818A7A|nr:hypothetical protein [Vibrio sp. S9_S30]MBD1559865.1 hypothetical protein [Vibrio sp. S9_S30]